MEDIDHYDIPVYNFPYDVEEDDEDTIQDNSELRVRSDELVFSAPGVFIPFAVFNAFRHHRLGGGS